MKAPNVPTQVITRPSESISSRRSCGFLSKMMARSPNEWGQLGRRPIQSFYMLYSDPPSQTVCPSVRDGQRYRGDESDQMEVIPRWPSTGSSGSGGRGWREDFGILRRVVVRSFDARGPRKPCVQVQSPTESSHILTLLCKNAESACYFQTSRTGDTLGHREWFMDEFLFTACHNLYRPTSTPESHRHGSLAPPQTS